MKRNVVNKHGFTLIELLTVVIIIGVLSAVAIPGYMRSVEKSRAVEAIQALNDISKAEHDYYLSKSKYTNDFSDLVLTQIDQNTLDEAEHSSYVTKFFTYNLDNNQKVATAKRSTSADSYTLYRFYDDPITYCQPKGNKYCEILDLPSGSFTHSIGAWQSCPGGVYPCSMNCSRNTTLGYSCYGTYNEDGTFTEKVCDANGICATTQYNEDQKSTKKDICYAYDDNNRCTNGSESKYDEEGHLLSSYKCTSWDENNNCTSFNQGYNYTYDANGNMTSKRSCKTIASNGSCSEYYSSRDEYTYDGNGNQTSKRTCRTVESNGSCSSYYDSTAYDYTYDANGNMTSERRCQIVESNGSCSKYYPERTDYTYDGNGNMTSSRYCQKVESDGSCSAYSSGRTEYTYDANGNMTSKRTCQTVASDGSCSAYEPGGYEYTYDVNGNMTSESSKYCYDDDCTVGSETVTNYVYDENGNMTSYQGSNRSFNNVFGLENVYEGDPRCVYPDGNSYSC